MKLGLLPKQKKNNFITFHRFKKGSTQQQWLTYM